MGDVVLKPCVDPVFQERLGLDLAGINQDGFRLPGVRRALDGAWVADRWAAYSAVPGSAAPHAGDWRIVIAATRALQAATIAVARPGFLDLRADPWAVGDRAARGDGRREVRPERRELVRRLDAALAPLGPSQLIHGDLTTNVLIRRGEPPSIIDFSPYWRPPSYAEGIVIGDALCWHGASPEILDGLEVPIPAVARGLLFRLLTTTVDDQRESKDGLEEEVGRYSSALDTLNLSRHGLSGMVW